MAFKIPIINLHSTIIATVSYGADHHGMLPTPYGHGQPWNTYVARGQGTWQRKNVGLLPRLAICRSSVSHLS